MAAPFQNYDGGTFLTDLVVRPEFLAYVQEEDFPPLQVDSIWRTCAQLCDCRSTLPARDEGGVAWAKELSEPRQLSGESAAASEGSTTRSRQDDRVSDPQG